MAITNVGKDGLALVPAADDAAGDGDLLRVLASVQGRLDPFKPCQRLYSGVGAVGTRRIRIVPLLAELIDLLPPNLLKFREFHETSMLPC